MMKEKNEENSQEQADIIKSISIGILCLDTEYCNELASDMIDQASRQDSMFILNPSHAQSKNDLLRTQGKALKLLCKYVETLKEVEKLKLSVKNEEETRERIAQMFI